MTERKMMSSHKVSQIKEFLIEQPRKLTRWASYPGYGSSDSLTQKSLQNFSPLCCSTPADIEHIFNDEFQFSNAKQDNQNCLDQNNPASANDEIVVEKKSSGGSKSKMNTKNLNRKGVDADWDSEKVIIISDDDEPKEKRFCYQENEDTSILEAIIDQTLNYIDEENYTAPGYVRKKKVNVVIDISDHLTDTGKNSSGSSSGGKNLAGKKIELDLVTLVHLSFTMITKRSKTFLKLSDKRFKKN